MKKLLITAIAGSALLAASAFAQQTSPVGLWKTIDDHSGKPKAFIRISESNGEMKGKVEKLLREPGEEQNPKCVKCEGALKDQPIIGMTILSGMKQDGDEYKGGQILDPDNGKFYQSKMSLTDNGKKLNVRGYIGVPLLGRTQTWIREE
ncbi:DUF2147 domain-containing protein [Paraherbaspirillum soli]|uniref:DUF2147 domain-containing protein n=1 Tax=Paraherbaspirillum soli TaxID=631222 RepID=A0ABW0MDF1_9BURK